MGYMESPDQLKRTNMLALGNLLHEHSTLHTLEHFLIFLSNFEGSFPYSFQNGWFSPVFLLVFIFFVSIPLYANVARCPSPVSRSQCFSSVSLDSGSSLYTCSCAQQFLTVCLYFMLISLIPTHPCRCDSRTDVQGHFPFLLRPDPLLGF